jgi:hypothetical protein
VREGVNASVERMRPPSLSGYRPEPTLAAMPSDVRKAYGLPIKCELDWRLRPLVYEVRMEGAAQKLVLGTESLRLSAHQAAKPQSASTPSCLGFKWNGEFYKHLAPNGAEADSLSTHPRASTLRPRDNYSFTITTFG